MVKKHKTAAKNGKHGAPDEPMPAADAPTAEAAVERAPLSTKDYNRELKKLHIELVKLQQWVVHKGLKVCIIFEGRDGAGKGGAIKAITERVSPRVFHVMALSAPQIDAFSRLYPMNARPMQRAAGRLIKQSN